MSEAREAIEAGVRAWNTGDIDGLMAHYADDATLWFSGLPLELKGKDQVRQVVQGYFTAFPGCQITIKNLIESGEFVVLEYVFRGTHNGPLVTPRGEIPATGKSVEGPVVDIFQFRGGKVIALRSYYDNMDLITQLGLMPAASAAST